MRVSELPSLNGKVTNGLGLAQNVARAISSVQVARVRASVEPEGTAALVAFFDAAKALLLAGKKPDRPAPGGVDDE